ncbi:MAG: DUF2905 domain-containing protein [Leptospira sp.]|nr:DUF2905 domain-containing protein [Leptospira sp.]
MEQTGKSIILLGVLLIVAGLFISYGEKIPFFGKLPGDISVKRENFSFYFPLTTSILVSVLISILLWFFNKR